MILLSDSQIEGERPTILSVGSDPLVCEFISKAMAGVDYCHRRASDGVSGNREAAACRPDIIILDGDLSDGTGTHSLSLIHESVPNIPVIFITARGANVDAIEAIQLSAFDFVSKPIDPSHLRAVIDRALSSHHNPSEQSKPLKVYDSCRSGSLSECLVGESLPMQNVFRAIGKVAGHDLHVLIRGEHGTGKEAVARTIHRHSKRAAGPFLTLSCRGLDERRLEQELFGSDEKGAGLIEQTAHGTLLLQEVSELPMSLQGRLVDVLSEETVIPQDRNAQVTQCRILASSSEDIEVKIRAFVITLPPLRQRYGDLPLLVDKFLEKLAPLTQSFGVHRPRVAEEVFRALERHIWPGNLDELQSVLKRGIVEQKGNLFSVSDLSITSAESSLAPSTEPGSTRYRSDWAAFAQMKIDAGADTLHADAIEEMEKKLFRRVLAHTGGNQAQASRILGIARASLRKKLRLYGIAPRIADDGAVGATA